jgi:NAD(P)-dependent dehydrogenase (short-subunit alcohol dehydrogenase family)
MDKLSVITGATSGIGYQTALQLAHCQHHLILVFRDVNKGTRAKNEILRQVPAAKVELVTADLSSQQQIARAAQQIGQLTTKIDVLINNAGTWYSNRTVTEDNIEQVFAVNHLSYFLLTHLLYPLLARSKAARIINISSDSHFKAKRHFEDLGLSKNYHGLRSYAQSKLANILFTYELDRRKPHGHITANAVQPGLVITDIGIKNTRWWHALAWKIRRTSGVSSEEGARTSVHLASSGDIVGVSAKYWEDCRPKPSSKRSYNVEDAWKLWEVSEKMCGITDYFEGDL